jgi:hypothetical protein
MKFVKSLAFWPTREQLLRTLEQDATSESHSSPAEVDVTVGKMSLPSPGDIEPSRVSGIIRSM